MSIFSYVITCDRGFAPNPFGGFLTLATCKPRIRRAAKKGDVILATGSVSTQHKRKLVYAAVVSDVVTIENYGRSTEYRAKRPSTKGQWWRRHGDNIYTKLNGRWKRRRNDYHTTRETTQNDLSGRNVLVCSRFWYFGANSQIIPHELRAVIHKGRGHQRIEDDDLALRLIDWLKKEHRRGRRGIPALSPKPADGCEANSDGC